MKKIVLVSLAFLFVLVGCGQKKETGPATKTEKDTLQSALPVIENAEKNTVVTKTLVLPKSDDGSQQTQTITYKDKTFLSLTIQQKRPVSDELKTYIDQHGVEETQKALLEAEEKDKDKSIIEARKLAGFKLETKLLSATELQTTTSFDFQVLDVKKASQLEHLKNIGLENLLKNEPSKYISDRLANGATEQ
ncbi:TPA: transcriptional regulator [Streptococcus pneumoniae]|nr:transcriptional regulator [Streptococcus pneumoniae]HEU6335434.1 transcriptional regulator [Streptococcus pneumoniae]